MASLSVSEQQSLVSSQIGVLWTQAGHTGAEQTAPHRVLEHVLHTANPLSSLEPLAGETFAGHVGSILTHCCGLRRHCRNTTGKVGVFFPQTRLNRLKV